MNKKERKFLDERLLELVDNGIISKEQQINANEYFSKYKKSSKFLVTVFSSIGILLIALSIITLFAINWDNIPKETKVLISFVPLIITAVMMFFYYKKNDSKLAIYTSIVAPISILATNSLIGQIFHIQTTIYELFFLSLIMFLPIAFMLRNYLSILTYGIGTIIYSFGVVDAGDLESYILINAFVLALPLFVYNVINYLKNKECAKNILMWVINVILITLFIFNKEIIRAESILIYLYMIYALTKTLFKKDNILNRVLSTLFVIYLIISCLGSYMVSFASEITFGIDTLILTLLVAGLVYISKLYENKKEWFILVFIALLQYTKMPEEVLFIFINILTILFGIYKIMLGNKESYYKEIKQGISLILVVIFFRFVNSDLSFTEKSIMFLVAGALFLIGSNIFRKKIGGDKNE